MFIVYVLYSLKDGKLYVGCTQDIKNRLELHNSGQVFATKHRRPLVVIHTENFENKDDAFKREQFLKSLWSARFKKKLKAEYFARQKNPANP